MITPNHVVIMDTSSSLGDRERITMLSSAVDGTPCIKVESVEPGGYVSNEILVDLPKTAVEQQKFLAHLTELFARPVPQ